MSGQYYPYTWGYKHNTMAGTMRSEVAMWSKSHQSRSQFGLEAETRLHEVGIASNGKSAITVNTFPGLVHTARQTMKVTNTRSPLRRPKVGA